MPPADVAPGCCPRARGAHARRGCSLYVSQPRSSDLRLVPSLLPSLPAHPEVARSTPRSADWYKHAFPMNRRIHRRACAANPEADPESEMELTVDDRYDMLSIMDSLV